MNQKNNIFYELKFDLAMLKIKLRHIFVSDEKEIQKKWMAIYHEKIDFKNPQTLNEKIQWLKLHDRTPLHTILADKYSSRAYIAQHYGEEYLIPLVFFGTKTKDISPENINEFPCVIKPNNSSGLYHIYRRKEDIDFSSLRQECKHWLKRNYYYESQEWQYKNMPHMYVVEKLLQDENGKIPNDYKFHFINGKCEFIYCSIDREGDNYRHIYTPEWKRLPFTWAGPKSKQGDNHPDISKPKCFDKMMEIASDIASHFAYVRVDFYEVNGKLYCGEVTFHHGSGLDVFNPKEYDKIYGDKLILPNK